MVKGFPSASKHNAKELRLVGFLKLRILFNCCIVTPIRLANVIILYGNEKKAVIWGGGCGQKTGHILLRLIPARVRYAE